jgi:kynureninase
MTDMIALIAKAGLPAIRAKSVALTEHAIALADELLARHGVRVASPRDPARRGSHVTLTHPAFPAVTPRLWQAGVIPDLRPPDSVRIGLSPLSTSHTELAHGIATIERALRT